MLLASKYLQSYRCIVSVCIIIFQEAAERARQDVGVPDLDTVFSQARNGRTKRIEESLNLGEYQVVVPTLFSSSYNVFFRFPCGFGGRKRQHSVVDCSSEQQQATCGDAVGSWCSNQPPECTRKHSFAFRPVIRSGRHIRRIFDRAWRRRLD